VCETLKERFPVFCESLDGAENIDRLPIPEEFGDLQKADFLFSSRQIICEIKSLQNQQDEKISRLLRRAGLNLTPGETYNLSEVLDGNPNKSKLFDSITEAITRQISKGLEEANRQIEDTKTIFGIDQADGIVVFLHGAVTSLSPDLIMGRIARRLYKGGEKAPYHNQIAGTILFSEIWKIKTPDVTAAAVLPLMSPFVKPQFGAETFMSYLADSWARWNGRRNHIVVLEK
jgi:hypothetical protein